jgi:hypothetical protein
MKNLIIAIALGTACSGFCDAQLMSGRGAREERNQLRAASHTAAAEETAAASTWWKLPLRSSWQVQYTGTINFDIAADIFDLDGFDTPASDVARLHASGRKAICYISAGTFENWRSDKNKFPAAVLGKTLGWPGERWLDIRRLDILGPIMEARMDICKAKGFDAVNPDNVDGYSNATGFPLTYHDQLAYNRFLAKAAHDRGLAVGLKNDVEQIADLVNDFDFHMNEQCFQYRECSLAAPFVLAGKPVFNVEYKLSTAKFCGQAAALQFNSIRKRLDLGAYREVCPE